MRQLNSPPKASSEGPKLLDQVRDKIRLKHYSIRTEQSYTDWVRRFILFHKKRHPGDMGAAEVEQFLTHLAVEGNVSASTQNQAKSALLFLYREVLEIELPWLDEVTKAKASTRLPVVLTVQETQRLLDRLEGTTGLIARLLYGTGMRVMEGARLRVKDIDFERRELIVREGKGNKDRVTMLPQTLVEPLQQHLVRVKDYMAASWPRALAMCICRLPWRASIRPPGVSGIGSMCFRQPSVRSIRAAAPSAVIM